MTLSRNLLLATAMALFTGAAYPVAAVSPAARNLSDKASPLSVTPAGAVANLSIGIDNGLVEVETGQFVTYQIVAVSDGPSSAVATVDVDFPWGLSSCNWTCSANGGASCAASGSGDIEEDVNLPAPSGSQSSVTFAATCLVNTSIPIPPPVTLGVPATITSSVLDPDTADNTASDVDDLIAVVDVAVSINDGRPYLWYGGSASYVIRVSSQGSDAIVRLVNTPPASLGNCNWTCETTVVNYCPTPTSGSGGIDVELILPAISGGLTEAVRFTNTCTLLFGADLKVVNTAQLVLDPPFRDPAPGNNQASDVDLIRRTTDLSVTVNDGRQYVRIGEWLDYAIRVDNAGPDHGEFTYVSSTLPAGLVPLFWTCTASPGATCHEGEGVALFDEIDIPAGGHVTYLFTARVGEHLYTEPIAYQIDALSDLETYDPTPNNNFATDSPPDIVVLFKTGFEPGIPFRFEQGAVDYSDPHASK